MRQTNNIAATTIPVKLPLRLSAKQGAALLCEIMKSLLYARRQVPFMLDDLAAALQVLLEVFGSFSATLLDERTYAFSHAHRRSLRTNLTSKGARQDESAHLLDSSRPIR